MKKRLTILTLIILISIHIFSQKDSIPIFEISTLDSGSIHGSALIDYNNDGLTDIFLSNFSETNSLYKNNGNFQFTAIETGSIVTDTTNSLGASWGDFDNDGDLDLYLANGNVNTPLVNCLYINNGDSTFTKDTSHILVQDTMPSFDCAWFDYNNDSYLDLYIINYNKRNELYKGLGNSNFIKVLNTETTNFTDYNASVILGDYNNDNFVDLYVPALQNTLNNLFKNNGDSSFNLDIGNIIMKDRGYGTGGSWGDYNNDGYLDLITIGDGESSGFKNYLYSNNRDGSFTLKASNSISDSASNSYGSSWFDIDNDGDLDLYIANANQNNWFYQNKGNGKFVEIYNRNFIDLSGTEVNLIWDDLDNDGDMDAFIGTDGNNPNYLIKNKGNDNNWVKFRLQGNCSNIYALGAKVRIKATIFGSSCWQMRELSSKSGNRVQASYNLHFGLGDAITIDSAIIEWPSGRKTFLTNIETNTIHIIEEEISNDYNIIKQPCNATLCKDEDAQFECKSYILNKNVIWQYYENNNWIDINSGSFDFSVRNHENDIKTSVLTIYNIQTSYNNLKIRCIIEDKCSLTQSISNEAILIITNCYEFSGEVYAGYSLLEKGIVELYDQSDSLFHSPRYTVEVINGMFFLPKIRDSWYHFLVKPFGEEKELFYPTYHYKTISQENSILFHVNKDVVKEFFYLVERSCSPATITSFNLIDNETTNFYDLIGSAGYFAYSMDTLGDINNDGFMDIVVGASNNDVGCIDCGSVFILFLDEDQNIISYKNLTKGADFPSLDIEDGDFFGRYVENIGDIDNDGVTDLFVSAFGNDDGGIDNNMKGAFYIIHLNADGTAKGYQKVSETSGNLRLSLSQYGSFGLSAVCIGDKNNDSIPDILVSQSYPKNLYVIYLNRNGTVKDTKTLEMGKGSFNVEFENTSAFGISMELIGDLDGDGNREIVISDPLDDEDYVDAGAIYILFPDNETDIKRYTKITSSSFFDSPIIPGDNLGYSVQYLGDFFNNGTYCVAVAAVRTDIYGPDKGIVYILSINKDGMLDDYMIIQSRDQAFENTLTSNPNIFYGIGIVSFNSANETMLLVSNLDENKVGRIFKHQLCSNGQPIHYLSISGYVNGDGMPIYNGLVKLFTTDNADIPRYEVDITNGRFVFNNIEPGQYYLCAEPTGFYSNYYSETFYVQTTSNSEALVLDISSSNANITINLLSASDVNSEINYSENKIKIFPNPATNTLNIQNVSNISSITITNIVGIEIKQFSNKNNFSISLDVSDLDPGVYLLVFEDNNGETSVHRFLKK